MEQEGEGGMGLQIFFIVKQSNAKEIKVLHRKPFLNSTEKVWKRNKVVGVE